MAFPLAWMERVYDMFVLRRGRIKSPGKKLSHFFTCSLVSCFSDTIKAFSVKARAEIIKFYRGKRYLVCLIIFSS